MFFFSVYNGSMITTLCNFCRGLRYSGLSSLHLRTLSLDRSRDVTVVFSYFWSVISACTVTPKFQHFDMVRLYMRRTSHPISNSLPNIMHIVWLVIFLPNDPIWHYWHLEVLLVRNHSFIAFKLKCLRHGTSVKKKKKKRNSECSSFNARTRRIRRTCIIMPLKLHVIFLCHHLESELSSRLKLVNRGTDSSVQPSIWNNLPPTRFAPCALPPLK